MFKPKKYSYERRFTFLTTLVASRQPSQQYELHAPDALEPVFSVYDRHAKKTAGRGKNVVDAVDNAISLRT